MTSDDYYDALADIAGRLADIRNFLPRGARKACRVLMELQHEVDDILDSEMEMEDLPTTEQVTVVIMPRVLIKSQTKRGRYIVHIRGTDICLEFALSNPGAGGWITLLDCRHAQTSNRVLSHLGGAGAEQEPVLACFDTEVNLRDIAALAELTEESAITSR